MSNACEPGPCLASDHGTAAPSPAAEKRPVARIDELRGRPYSDPRVAARRDACTRRIASFRRRSIRDAAVATGTTSRAATSTDPSTSAVIISQMGGIRDPDRTRAGLVEFAAHGRAGARTGAIAARAGVNMELVAIGRVESALTDRASAPKQGDEGAPEAWLVFEPGVAEALDGIEAGDELLVLTWLDRARRDVLRVHPRGDPANAEQGVFNTRSPDRPNPIGLHRVTVVAIDGLRLRVRDLEALDGTPVVDVKPLLRTVEER